MTPTKPGYYWATATFLENERVIVEVRRVYPGVDVFRVVKMSDPEYYQMDQWTDWKGPVIET